MRRVTAILLCIILFMMSALSACKKEKDEDLLVDDEIFASFDSREESSGTVEQVILQPETEEDPPVLSNSEIYNLEPNRIAEQDDSVYFLYSSSMTSPGTYYLMAADLLTGIMKPLCSKPDCPHERVSCGAYEPYIGSGLTTISASENRLYYAGTMQSGSGVFRRKFPDGAAEQVAYVNLLDMFPEKPNYTWHYNTSCFYEGDFYYPICAGTVPENGSVRENEFYATVYRSPVTSGNPERSIVQDKITGYDNYTVGLMPRGEGLYIIELMSKEERTEEGIHTLQTRIDIFLHNPQNETTEPVFSTEYGEGLYIQNCCIRNGKVYFVAYDRTVHITQLFEHSMMESEPKLLLSLDQGVNEIYRHIYFTGENICVYGEGFSGEALSLELTLYDYHGQKINRFNVNKPDELKPEDPGKYMTDGRLSGMTEVLGSGDRDLYFHDSYWSMKGEYEDFYYAVSQDGLRVIPFVRE